MGGDNSSKGRLATLLAVVPVVGAVVTGLTLYYSRQDAKEKAAQNRPIIEFSARLIETGRVFRNMPLLFVFEGTFLNRGTQIASAPILHLNDKLYEGKGDITLGDIGPSQSLKQKVELTKEQSEDYGPFRIEGALHYKDRINPGREFNEPFCLEGDTQHAEFTRREFSFTPTSPNGGFDDDYTPPIQLSPCMKDQ